MYDPDQDTFIIRSESVFYYFATLSLLLYLNLIYIALFYAFGGFSMAWDEMAETELEDDMVEFEEVMISDSTIVEMLGFEFDTEDLEFYMETVTEDIVFVGNYRYISKFKKKIHRYISKFKKNNKTYIQNNICPQKNIISYYQTKNIRVTKKYRKKFSYLKLETKNDIAALKKELFKKESLDESDYLELRQVIIKDKIATDFIISSYIASGLYPTTDFDFDTFKLKLET